MGGCVSGSDKAPAKGHMLAKEDNKNNANKPT